MIDNGMATETVPYTNSNYKRYQIYIGGIAGSGFTSNYINFTGEIKLLDGRPNVQNSYTYFDFPSDNFTGGNRLLKMFTIASISDRNGYSEPTELSNCYFLGSVKNNDVDVTYGATKLLDGKEPTSVTYAQLCGTTYVTGTTEIYAALNNGRTGDDTVWEPVATTDKMGVSIDGKFSYPIRDELQGKNYPFPTVITQNDLTFGTVDNECPVHVHYGDWPIVGSYWAKGQASMDIFTDMDDSKYGAFTTETGWQSKHDPNFAYQVFTLHTDSNVDGGNLPTSIVPGSFRYSDSGTIFGNDSNIAEVVDVKQVNTNTYEVLVKALDAGSTQIRLGDIASATFSLQVTANWTISATAGDDTAYDADSATLWLGSGAGVSGKLTLSAEAAAKASGESTAKDYSYSESRLQWTADGDNLNPSVTQPTASSRAAAAVQRNADGTLTLRVTATYTYPSLEGSATQPTFTKQLFITVKMPATVGIVDADEHWQTEVGAKDKSQVDAGSWPSYTLGESPENNNLYLFTAAADSDIFGTISSITIGGDDPISVGDEGDHYNIDFGDVTLDETGTYAILPAKVTYKTAGDEPAGDLPVTVTFTSGNTLTVTLAKDTVGTVNTGYNLNLYKTKREGEKPTVLVVNAPTSSIDTPTFDGWTFCGWFDGSFKEVTNDKGVVVNSGSGENYTIINGQLTLSGDVNLYAKWKRTRVVYVEDSSPARGNTYVIAYGTSPLSSSGSETITVVNNCNYYLDENETNSLSGKQVIVEATDSQVWDYTSEGTLECGVNYLGIQYSQNWQVSLDTSSNNPTTWSLSGKKLYYRTYRDSYYLRCNNNAWGLSTSSSANGTTLTFYVKTTAYEFSWSPES